MTLQAVDENSFADAVLTAGTPVLVDFWAQWCLLCTTSATRVQNSSIGRLDQALNLRTPDGQMPLGPGLRVKVSDDGEMKPVRVGNLLLGQVISSDEERLAPALIEAMTSAGDRQLQLRDLDSGERIERIVKLAADQLVLLHDIEVEHHIYTNVTQEPIEVRLGPDSVTVGPGSSFHHTGRARPDVFRGAAWSHQAA